MEHLSEIFLILFMVTIFIVQCKILNDNSLFEDFDVESYEKLEKEAENEVNEISKNMAIGPYDNLKLDEKVRDDKLLDNDKVVDVYGNSVPLKDDKTKPDGTDDLFMFSNNKCSPECCPGIYSCDRGCVCESKDQLELLSTRGGNKKYSSEIGK